MAQFTAKNLAVEDVSHRGYQSAAALEAATTKKEEADVGEPVLAEDTASLREVVVVNMADQEKQVRVRLRTFQSFRMGPRTFTIPANKEVLVPQYVRQHLMEKGLL